MRLLPLLIVGCDGCNRHGLPDVDFPEPSGSADTSEDTDSGSGDSALPAMCEVEEVEPNVFATPQALPMEAVACGVFESAADQEWFTFEVTRADWLRVTASAESRGSSADTLLAISFTESDATMLVKDSYLSSEASAVFPVTQTGGFHVGITEQDARGGEDYFWYLIATVSKPPVDWTFQEVEDNDDLASAEVLPLDDIVLGTFGVPEFGLADEDWYVIQTPPGATDAPEGSPYVTAIRFEVRANSYGSPVDPILHLKEADGTDVWGEDRFGRLDYDLDPFDETKVTEAHEWYVSIQNEREGEGSPFHWYTLQVSAIYSETPAEE